MYSIIFWGSVIMQLFLTLLYLQICIFHKVNILRCACVREIWLFWQQLASPSVVRVRMLVVAVALLLFFLLLSQLQYTHQSFPASHVVSAGDLNIARFLARYNWSTINLQTRTSTVWRNLRVLSRCESILYSISTHHPSNISWYLLEIWWNTFICLSQKSIYAFSPFFNRKL